VNRNRDLGRYGPRLVATFAVVVLTATYLSVLYEAVDVAGDVELFAVVVAGALLAGLLLGRVVPESLAIPIALVIAVAGGALYVTTVPDSARLFNRLDLVLEDVVALFTGLSILRIINAGVWATAFAPVPVFLSWFFVGRRRYALATVVGAAALVFFVLTGDASVVLALFGVLAAATAVGVGDVDRRGGRLADADGVAVVVAAMVVLTVSVSLVPGGASQPLLRDVGGSADTLEASLTDADGEISIQGSISLSPEVRFEVEAEERRYWKVGAYDRYTGDGWVRTAATSEFDGTQRGPPGPTRRVDQAVTAETELSVLPAAWKATRLDGTEARVTGFGSLTPADPLAAGERYEVVSRVSTAGPDQLRAAGDDYGAIDRGTYTQLPESTPQELTEYTTTLTANANNSYDTARIIERHLEQQKRYSLDVDRPSGDIASEFLFEMEAGYCTYYATTMVTMLRSQGIPARFVTGYTPGQSVDDDYVVRGLNAHAWVEVYFPGYGWQQFDPTPAGPRQATERDSLDSARSNDTAGVDVPGSTPTPTPTATPTPTPTATPTDGERNDTAGTPPDGAVDTPTPPGLGDVGGGGFDGATDTEVGAGGGGGGGISLPSPSREEVALGTVVVFGVAAAVRRSGAADRAYRAVWLRHQPRTGDPTRDIERAHDRMEYLLTRERRPRATGETSRRYLRSLGDRDAMRVGELYEEAVYAGRTDEAAADEAVRRVDELVKKYRRF
jgi:transglutaminase-like putative cysteine protease